jgi:hypothetical protein
MIVQTRAGLFRVEVLDELLDQFGIVPECDWDYAETQICLTHHGDEV